MESPVRNQTTGQLHGWPVLCSKTTSGLSTSRWRTLAKHPRGAKILFFFFNEGPPPPSTTLSDRRAKHVHLGNIRTLLNYVARIFTFLQPKFNDVRHGAQLKRWTAILYTETQTELSPFCRERHTQLQS